MRHHLTSYLLCCLCLGLATACTTATADPDTPLPTAAAVVAEELPTVANTAAAPPTLTYVPTAVTEQPPTTTPLPSPSATATPTITPTPSITPPPTAVPYGGSFVIGRSWQDLPIEVYKFGSGSIPVVFVGGMHGGYEWNTIVLAYAAIDYFAVNPQAIPPSVTLYIIPSANPDGQYAVTFKTGRFTAADVPDDIDTSWGRFNSKGVDLNRNWDCEWEPTGTWGDRIVSAGSGPFSEPESIALRDFLMGLRPDAVVFWHSAANIVTPSGCDSLNGDAVDLARLYANASGYPYSDAFSAYYITGDAADWLADQGVPSITVEFRNHVSTDWERNLAGMTAVLEQYR